MFAFVNIKNHKLFDLKRFTNVFSSFPNVPGEKENQLITTWIQGLDALWIHFIVPHIHMTLNHKISEGFGNLLGTFREFYGVDARFMESGEFAFEEMSDACVLFHKFVGAEKDIKKKNRMRRNRSCNRQLAPD